MTATLNEHARHRRWCSRSRRWWNDELRDLRVTLGRAKRTRNWARIESARRELRRAIRKAKKDCWNRFLQDAEGNNVWTATRYTSVRIDKAGQVLVDEDGFQAETQEDRRRTLLKGHFPPAPTDTLPYEGAVVGGPAYQQVDQRLVGALLGKTASTAAPGNDQISAGILKVFWEWDPSRITQLVRACIRLGHHQRIWKTAKGIVIPKLGKPDYSRIRAYRVISLLDVIAKLVERTAAHLIADHLERSKGLHEGQSGCRKRRSCVDAVATLMNRTQQE